MMSYREILNDCNQGGIRSGEKFDNFHVCFDGDILHPG